MTAAHDPGDRESVSLVMTVLNEAADIGAFLSTLAAQTRAPDELVVVDGGSTDHTVTMIEGWARSVTWPVRVEVRRGANIAEGRNAAIALAKHDLLAVTDAGTLLDAGWLASLLHAREPGVDVVCGFFAPSWSSWRERLLASSLMPLASEIDPATFLPSSRSLLISRRAWEAAGGYPQWLDYCEDLVFDIAMKRAGLNFVFAGGAIARWSARSSFTTYAKQYYRYARGDGKAGLWPKRHAVRYVAYATGVAGLVLSHGPLVPALLTLGFAGYTSRYFRRVWSRRPDSAGRTVALLASVPAVAVVGDVAKMAGYPAGRMWRIRRRNGRGT